jgi:site-specific DNA-methyltransferase (adenine-specific)
VLYQFGEPSDKIKQQDVGRLSYGSPAILKGATMKVPIGNFMISSDYRADREDISDLAFSISQNGLLEPIIVDRVPGMTDHFDVKGGRRRLFAMRDFLLWEELEEGNHFVVREGCDSLVVQFEENFRRKDFKPLEIAKLVKDIHEERVKQHGVAVQGVGGGWSLDKTAKLLSKDKSFISRLISIADHPTECASCSTLTEAIDVVAKIKQQKAQSIIRKKRVEEGEKKTKGVGIGDYTKRLANTDALSFVKSLKDSSVDLIYTDPPFGLDIDEIAGSDDYTAYRDDPTEVMDLLTQLMPEYYRVLKDNKFAVIWTSHDWVRDVKKLMASAGFHVARVPLFWVKINSAGKTNNPNQELGSIVETAVYGCKGKAELTIKGKQNVFPFPTVRKNRIHVAQKDENLIVEHLTIFSIPGDLVVDTFSGSGATLRACYRAKRQFAGCEMKEEHYLNSILYSQKWAEEEDK